MIDFEVGEGWFNATAAAQRFGKDVYEWVRTSETTRYICVLKDAEEDVNIWVARFIGFGGKMDAAAQKGRLALAKQTGLVVTKRGRHGGGTWLHPKLAVVFARWLSSEFALWCDMQIASCSWEDKLAEIIPELVSRAGYVYVISNGEKVKIGRSINPEDRVRSISTQGGMKLVDTCFVSCENAHTVEAAAHLYFANRRGIGEWFSTPFDEAVTYVKQLAQQEVMK